jgi:hypothetical protein
MEAGLTKEVTSIEDIGGLNVSLYKNILIHLC